MYDRQHVILETDGSSGTSLAYYLYNGHGDVVQTVTAAGEVQNRYDYDIFGNPTLSIEVSACNIRYAGEYLDNETGLYYLRARYYDPSIGRFISEDSYWGEDTNPLSLNLYTYCYNDPIRFIDPTGHTPYEDIIANARKQAQTNSIINEINEQKDIWFAEERGAGKNQKTWTDAQTEANRRAEALRQQLIQLESGNADIQKLIKDDSKAIAGAWEGYQMSVTARLADANPNVDYSDTIRRQAQDYALAEKYGRNAIGIDAGDICAGTRTAVERFAESVVAGYQTSRIVNSFTAGKDEESATGNKTMVGGKRTYQGLILAYSGNDLSMFTYAYSGSGTVKTQSAEELLNDLLGLITSYSDTDNHWLAFLGFKTKKQKELHTNANEIRDNIKLTNEYKSDPEFAKLVDETFDKGAYKEGNTKKEIQALIDYLQEKKPVPDPVPDPVPAPEPILEDEGTGKTELSAQEFIQKTVWDFFIDKGVFRRASSWDNGQCNARI